MAHLHSVYDTDNHFIINPVTREIDNKSGKIKLMLGDHNSERFTFEIPRTVDGHDMTLCDSVEIHYINIDASTRQTIKDVYQAIDVQISPDSDDVVIFSWLLSGNTTKYFGTLNFRVTFKCISEGGTIDYAWSTDIYKGISVSDGINNTETVATEYSDILEQWKIGLDVLPAVTEADDGKVLQVEGGEWVAKKLPVYEEEYFVTPSATAQTLSTAGKTMTDDLTVEEIPYYEVSNAEGGTTVNIG